MAEIDEQLLDSYSTSFYGYGAYTASIWFVGMEEGGDLMDRLAVWQKRGRLELDDVGIVHDMLGVTKWYGERALLQPTVSQLARIALVARGHGDDNELVREYQRAWIGRPGRGDRGASLLELLPLPCRSLAAWPYAERTSLPQLADRLVYREHYGPLRAENLKRRIDEHGPKAVVFYGIDGWYRRWWEWIAGTRLAEVEDGIWLSARAGTAFMLIKGPTTQGLRSSYFRRAGRHLARAMTPESRA